MRDSPDLSVVIPVFNEETNIVQTLEALKRHVSVPHEILIVYDRDEDTTLPVVRAVMDQYPNLSLVKNAVGPGPSGALRTGFSTARAARVLVVMADLCDDLSQVDQCLKLMSTGADIVCPSRYCKGGAQILGSRWRVKAWIPRLAGTLLRGLSGMPTSDPTNSFKFYSAEILQRLRLSSTVSFSVTLEVLAKAHCLGYRIVEVPTVWCDRQRGQSNFPFGRSLVTYLPWFGVALLRNRLFRLPPSWYRARLSRSLRSMPEGRSVPHDA